MDLRGAGRVGRRAGPRVGFVEAKTPDFDYVEQLLEDSRTSGQWANFGPVSRRLEAEISEHLGVDGARRVVACASGTAALHALVNLYGYLAGEPLRWIVSSLTFACQRQGPLAESIAQDCDAAGFLDLDAVATVPADAYDGIVVTHLFGGTADTAAWTALARQSGKRLIFDSAAGFGSAAGETSANESGDGEAFSFHHTKPCGVGEGGCVVLPAEHEDTFRSLINFGRYGQIDTGPFSTNGKLSDIAAAFISDRLRGVARIRAAHRREWQRIVGIAGGLGYEVAGDPSPGLPSLAALLAPCRVGSSDLANDTVTLLKQYRPVPGFARAEEIYRRLVCVPCHADVGVLTDDELAAVLAGVLRAADNGTARTGPAR